MQLFFDDDNTNQDNTDQDLKLPRLPTLQDYKQAASKIGQNAKQFIDSLKAMFDSHSTDLVDTGVVTEAVIDQVNAMNKTEQEHKFFEIWCCTQLAKQAVQIQFLAAGLDALTNNLKEM